MPIALLSALPFTFFTPELHVITPSALPNAVKDPNLQVKKYFLKSHIEDIKSQLQDVKTLGPAAAEEWFKGLECQGKERLSDSSRWERWESLATGPPTRIAMSPGQSGYQGLQGPFNPPRPERTMREVTELKAARRAEIERRCSELDPPIPPRILQHMDSFQAAMQMSMALTDSQWELLRPRLLDQRDMAERSEKDEAAQRAHLLGEGEERHRREAAEKEDKEAQEKAWDDVQRPIRDLLAVYADEIIRDRWSRGETLSKDTSPKFASDVLIYARRRFYADMANGDEDRKRVGRSVDDGSPSAPATRKLNLENMKWLFDTKIKPLTEQYRKELFLCHTCEHPSKFYGFEGVVQHFAAKHTNELSHGSIVVHWKAEWPEFPPFHPDPSAAKAAFHAAANPPGVGAVPSVSGYNHGAFPHGPGSARFSQYSPAPFNHPNFAEQHPRHQNGMFAPPPPYQGPSQAFSAGAHYQGYDGYSMQYQPQAALGYGSPHPGPIYPVPVQGSPQMAPQVFGHHPGHFGLNPGLAHPLSHAYPHPSPMMGHAQPNPHMSAPTGSMYQTQLEEMAASARDVWSNTSGIKDLPGSVRAHIVIHQTVARFKAKFPNEPSLAMFIEGLASHSRMKPVNNLNGLICKACQPGGEAPGTGFQSHPPRFPAGDKKLYTLPALLNHFKAVHLEQHASGPNMPGIGGTPPRMDWKTDMVELPAQSAIAALLHAPGLDDGKLKLIAEVFPKAFPWPLPTLDSENSTGPVPVMHGPEGPEYRGIKVQVPDYVGPSKVGSGAGLAVDPQSPCIQLRGDTMMGFGPTVPNLPGATMMLDALIALGRDDSRPRLTADLQKLTAPRSSPDPRPSALLNLAYGILTSIMLLVVAANTVSSCIDQAGLA
ncbi:MAG: hypothetical protein M1832_002085 [Thelocarpon impressellum]|nr:MAG: hypothetical protein M1832_002085 [Thelocarpon impressellum]